MSVRLITPPVSLAVRLSEMKNHLGVTVQDRDLDIEALTRAATNFIQKWTSRTFVNTTYRFTMEGFPCRAWKEWFQLPFPPLSSITSIQYYDGDGALQTYTDYQIDQTDDAAAIIRPAINGVWPGTQSDRVGSVIVEYVAGYGATDASVPDEAKHAIKLLVRHWFDNAGAVVVGTISKEIEFALRSLIRSLGTGFVAHV